MGVVVPNVGYNALDGSQKPVYGGNYYPPGVVKSTNGAAGTPGSWLAGGSTPPAHAQEAAANGVVANPATAWTTGQYMQGRDPSAGGQMFWNGTAWVSGKA